MLLVQCNCISVDTGGILQNSLSRFYWFCVLAKQNGEVRTQTVILVVPRVHENCIQNFAGSGQGAEACSNQTSQSEALYFGL